MIRSDEHEYGAGLKAWDEWQAENSHIKYAQDETRMSVNATGLVKRALACEAQVPALLAARDAEIARLRTIETAARACNKHLNHYGNLHDYMDDARALRAALKGPTDAEP